MRGSTVWAGLLGIEHATVERVEYDEDAALVVAHVRPSRSRRDRCGRCGKRSARYDQGAGRRRWRTLDLGVVRAVLEADAPRVRCRVHGVTVAAVSWARHDSGHTRAFDDQVAWLAVQCSKTAVTALMRIAWRTVGSIVARVWADTDRLHDRFADLRRLGIDEISYKRGHRYLTVIVDHDSGRLVWAAPGHDMATLQTFFDLLGPQRCAQITHVSADGADFISTMVAKNCPAAVRCADPFHVVRWATDALDDVRRQAWNDARRLARATEKRGPGRPPAGSPPRPATERARGITGARYALWKNPENLTDKQRAKLEWIARTDPRLYRAYQLKEGLRLIFQMPIDQAAEALDRWVSCARRCRIPSFVKLQRTIAEHTPSILAAIEHGLSNGRTESVNTKVRLITRIAFGFKSPEALIALAMLNLGGHRPVLPNRQ